MVTNKVLENLRVLWQLHIELGSKGRIEGHFRFAGFKIALILPRCEAGKKEKRSSRTTD
jgi:hypothetical protein